MLHLRAKAVRWVADGPQPGLVEVSMTDAHGTEWRFVDKPPIFATETLTPQTPYPVDVTIACEVVGRTTDSDEQELLVVSTLMPWGLKTIEGVNEFEVSRTQLTAG